MDDGLATGATARAALRTVRRQGPERVVPAVPVCSPEAADPMGAEADEVLCPRRPAAFVAVGLRSDEFDRLTDQDVLDALHAAGH